MLAENEEGYRNLIRITSEASLHGFYRKPRVSKKFLAEHSKGLIGFSGCLSGELCEELMAGHYEKAKAAALQYQDIFGSGNFYLEIQDQGLEPEKQDPGRPVPSRKRTRHPSRRSPTTRTISAAKTPTPTT